MRRLVWLIIVLMLPAFFSHSANKQHQALKLADNMTNLVRWTPEPSDRGYRDFLPRPEKMDVYRNLGYGAVTLAQKHEILLRKDRVVEETRTSVQLYVSANGVANAGSSGFWVDANNQRVSVQQAYVLQPDGTRIEVDPGTLQINSDNSANIFNDYYYVTVPFAQVRPGSISVLVYKTDTDLKKSPLPWSRMLYPDNLSPIESFQVQVDWVDERLKPAWKTDAAGLACREGPLSLYCFSKEATPPFPSERDMASVLDLLPELVLAESTDWAAISATMKTLSEAALSKTGEVKALAEQLTHDAVTPQDKLSRLAAFVSRDIRYVGIEHGRNGVVPKPTLTTLAQHFGDCKDKTMLFVDLARHVGLDAYPVLTATNRKSLAKLLLPASSYFDHMIACVKVSQDQESCVDLTDSDTSAEHLPQAIQGAVSLAVGRGVVAPAKLPAEPFTWKVSIKADNRFTDDGGIVETLERSYDSHWAAGLRHGLAAKSQLERERWLLEDYRNVMTDKVTPSVLLAGLELPTSPLVMTSTTEFRNAFDPAAFTRFVEIDPWLRELSRNSKTVNTHYPLSFQGLDYQSRLTYQLNPGRRVKNTGPKLDYVSPWGSLHRHYRDDGGSVTVYTTLQMPRAEIPVDDLSQFNRFLELATQETRIWFGIQPVQNQKQ